MARLLIDSGIASSLDMDYDSILGGNSSGRNLAPPVSKSWMNNEFNKYVFKEYEKVGFKCPICLVSFVDEDHFDENINLAIKLPNCNHTFHKSCMQRWLDVTNSCPMCRYEFPTDDPNYEEFKRQKKREKIREQELAALHDSMFS